MTSLQEIENLWAVDCKMDRTQLDVEALKQAELHNKYYKIYLKERIVLKSEELSLCSFVKLKTEYYQGKLDAQTLKEYNWEQFQLTILKADIDLYLSADKEIQEKKLRIAIQKEKVDFLHSIINSINNRGFAIKNSIDFLRWTQGS